jgi:hypothetical protein
MKKQYLAALPVLALNNYRAFPDECQSFSKKLQNVGPSGMVSRLRIMADSGVY